MDSPTFAAPVSGPYIAGSYWTDFHDAEHYPIGTTFYVSRPGIRSGCVWRLLEEADRERMTRAEREHHWRLVPMVDISITE